MSHQHVSIIRLDITSLETQVVATSTISLVAFLIKIATTEGATTWAHMYCIWHYLTLLFYILVLLHKGKPKQFVVPSKGSKFQTVNDLWDILEQSHAD